MRRRAVPFLTALLLACAAGLGIPPGRAALAPADEAELKTLAVRGARAEIARNAGITGTRPLVLLDTLVGPTPAEHLYDWAHRPEWLEAMRATRLVDDLFGPRTDRAGVARRAVVIEVGAPFPAGGDTLAILYDWCVRRLPTRQGPPEGRVSVWRDAFVRSDTGWARVSHAPAVAPTGCTP